MDISEIQQKEIDSLRDENIELREKVKRLESEIDKLKKEKESQ